VSVCQIHPKVAEAAGIKNGDAIAVESPGALLQELQIWSGIREDTIFVPHVRTYAENG